MVAPKQSEFAVKREIILQLSISLPNKANHKADDNTFGPEPLPEVWTDEVSPVNTTAPEHLSRVPALLPLCMARRILCLHGSFPVPGHEAQQHFTALLSVPHSCATCQELHWCNNAAELSCGSGAHLTSFRGPHRIRSLEAAIFGCIGKGSCQGVKLLSPVDVSCPTSTDFHSKGSLGGSSEVELEGAEGRMNHAASFCFRRMIR